MSNRIKEILEVLEEVRERYLEHPTGDVTSMRIKAIYVIANQRQIDIRSVLDKCTRQLKPEVKDAAHFDELVRIWLTENSQTLYQIIQNHTSDSDDIVLIKNFFERNAISDIDLAIEFGYKPIDKTFVEGKTVLKLHLVKERDTGLVRDAKRQWYKEQNGNISCSVCKFSFLDYYGHIGEGYIEAHHKVPISTLTSEIKVKINDLIPVCSNCHRMLHRNTSHISIEELKQMVLKQQCKNI